MRPRSLIEGQGPTTLSALTISKGGGKLNIARKRRIDGGAENAWKGRPYVPGSRVAPGKTTGREDRGPLALGDGVLPVVGAGTVEIKGRPGVLELWSE